MHQAIKSFGEGGIASAPLLLGVIPFGMITGAAATEQGLSLCETIGMSLVVYAGASQLAVIHLMGTDATMAVLLFTGFVINLRMLMYSASLAPYLNRYSVFRRSMLAFVLTDQAYAVSIARFSMRGGRPVSRGWFYFGAGVTIWAGFQAAAACGALLGALIPPKLDLGFAVPLTFIALTVPLVRDRACMWSAATSGGAALLAFGLPYNLGLPVAAAAGIWAGCFVERGAVSGRVHES